MVDATASFDGMAGQPLAVPARFVVDLSNRPDRYLALAENALASPAQSALWISAWLRNVPTDPLFVVVSQGGSPVFALGLEILRKGPAKIARLIGGTHANGNFAPTLNLPPEQDEPLLRALMSELQRSRPDIDLIRLDRLVPSLAGRRNPLTVLKTLQSPDVALSASLAGGFDKVLERHSGKRKRKRHRHQTRKFTEVGAIEIKRAATPDEVDAMLSAYFTMKAKRFRALGIADAFGKPAVQAFFRDLYRSALDTPKPAFVLDSLVVGDKIRSVSGSSEAGSRRICDFTAFTNDELAPYSPGEFLLHEAVARACKDGFSAYDLGVGDEGYKRHWCEVETWHRTLLHPFSLRGRLVHAAVRAELAAKAALKRNRAGWQLVKALRNRRARPDQSD